jgi:hypothetical protein
MIEGMLLLAESGVRALNNFTTNNIPQSAVEGIELLQVHGIPLPAVRE